MNIPKTVALATAFPSLFREIYWGRFKQTDDAITPEIIENRNRLARDWKLAKLADLAVRYPPRPPRTDWDHVELYRDAGGGLVLVVSNYNGPPPKTLGMQFIYPIYSTAARSYARRFATVKEMRGAGL